MENLSNEELKLGIEALLFTSSVQVFSEHTDEHCKQMLQIAQKLNESAKVKPTHVTFLVETEYEENYAEDILKTFKDVPRVGLKDLLGV